MPSSLKHYVSHVTVTVADNDVGQAIVITGMLLARLLHTGEGE